MIKFSKLIASVLTSVMTFSMAATAAFAAVPTDVANTKYAEAAEVLGVLEVMVGDTEGTFRPDDTIIRSEVAKVGVAISGLKDVADITGGTTKYPDVPAGHWATGFINVATDQKLVVGDTEGTFRPDAQISYAEAVTILVRALGYEPRALAKGGYPTGYLVTASDIGLTKGVSGTQNKLITRGEVAQLAFNALTINMMEQTGFGNDINYEVVEKTLLEDKLDVEKVTGQVMAVGNASIDGGSNLSKNEIMIDDEVYETGTADVRRVLGFTVDAYINESDELLLAIPSAGKNDSVTVAAEDIAEITNTEAEKELQYWADSENDKKPTKESISADAKIIYNGKAGTAEDFKVIETGSITLLDTDSNGSNDVVFVNETVNYVVEEVVESTHKIVDKYGQKTLVADPDDDNLTFVITKGTEQLQVGDLKEWDVLTATISKDGELVYVEVSGESVTGKITEKSKDTYYINGKGYKVAKNYPFALNLQDEGTFYLDIEGKIAAVDGKTVSSENYAYLSNAGLSNGMDKVLEIKVFTKDGKTTIYDSASKISVNGVKGLTPEQALSSLKGEGEAVAAQLITFETNSNGEVTEINTATSSASVNEDKFTMNMKEDGVVYKSASGKLVGKSMSVNITDETIVFDIPAGKTDTSDYSVKGADFFQNDSTYNVSVFDVTEERNAKAVIVTNATGTENEEAPIAIVDSIAQSKNDDDEDVQKLYAYRDGEKVELTTTEDGILVKGDKALEQGDIVQLNTNSEGEIESVKVLFDISAKETESENKVSDKVTTYYGKVIKKFSGSFNMQVNGGTIHNFAIGNADIYTVDTTKTRNQISVGDSGDIQKYDELEPEKIFVRVYDNIVKEIVIVK